MNGEKRTSRLRTGSRRYSKKRTARKRHPAAAQARKAAAAVFLGGKGRQLKHWRGEHAYEAEI
jgi:hypothetical protein